LRQLSHCLDFFKQSDVSVDAFPFARKGVYKALAVSVATDRDLELHVWQYDGVEAVRVERVPLNIEVDVVKKLGDQPVFAAITHVVQANIEGVARLSGASAEHRGATARDVMSIKDRYAFPGSGKP